MPYSTHFLIFVSFFLSYGHFFSVKQPLQQQKQWTPNQNDANKLSNVKGSKTTGSLLAFYAFSCNFFDDFFSHFFFKHFRSIQLLATCSSLGPESEPKFTKKNKKKQQQNILFSLIDLFSNCTRHSC